VVWRGGGASDLMKGGGRSGRILRSTQGECATAMRTRVPTHGMGKEEELDEEASRESLGCGPGVGLLGGRGPVEVSVRCTRNSTARDPVGQSISSGWCNLDLYIFIYMSI
jgi:hypothetical protein